MASTKNILIFGSDDTATQLVEDVLDADGIGMLCVSPGNADIEAMDYVYTVDVDPTDADAIIEYCQTHYTTIVIPGPGIELAPETVTALLRAGIISFGPENVDSL